MTETYILIQIKQSKPIADLTDKAAGRIYTMDGVEDVTATLLSLEKLQALAADAIRYRWLRGDIRKNPRMFDWPYVMNSGESRLYAVKAHDGDKLNTAVDQAMIEDMASFIFKEALVEGDERFSDPEFQFSDEFGEECEEKAKSAIVDFQQAILYQKPEQVKQLQEKEQ